MLLSENTKGAIIRIRLMKLTETEEYFFEHAEYYQEDLDTKEIASEFNDSYDSDFKVISDESPTDLYNRIENWIDEEVG